MSTHMGVVSNFAIRFTIAIALLSVVANANFPQTDEPQPPVTKLRKRPPMEIRRLLSL